MSALPQGWVETALGEIVTLRGDKIDPASVPEKSFIGLEDIEPHTSAILRVGRASEVKSSVACFEAGDVLYSRLRPYLNKVTRPDFPGVASAEILALKPSDAADAEFVLRNIMTRGFLDFTAMLDKGDRPRVSYDEIAAFQLPLPPLPEQRRIVAKIDSLTGKSRRARDHLDHIPRLVEKYRHAVLASAFSEGERAAWKNGKLEEFITDALIGLVRGKSEQSDVSGVPYIRMNHYDLNGHWNDNKLTFVEATPQEIERYELRRGDVLFNTRNSVELVGKVALWQDGRDRHVYNNNILRLRFNEKVVPRFATLWMMSEPFRAYLQTQKSATTSVCAIYQRSIMAAPFPLPSVAEQKAVVTKIDSAFAWIDRLTADATNARKLIDHLDQSVLAKAFTGELVPQDPADEPASALLDRIRAERTGAPKAKRGRKKAA